MAYRVGLTYDLYSDYKISPDAPADSNCELDSQQTIENIANAFEELGLSVLRIGNAKSLLNHLQSSLSCEIVFNIAEGTHGRNRESWVPILLELYDVPYAGSDPLSLSLSLDKFFAKKIFRCHSIPTPNFIKVENPDDLKGRFHLRYPVILKLNHEGSSKGLSPNSVVRDARSLKRQLGFLLETYKEPILIEEFIEGQEFTAVIIGNRVAGVVERHVDRATGLGSPVFTARRDISFKNRPEYLPIQGTSKVLERRISKIAIAAFEALECRDMARVDFRIAQSGKIYVLEINPLPSFASDDTFYLLSEYLGWGFPRMLAEILNCALKRYGKKPVPIPALSLDSV